MKRTLLLSLLFLTLGGCATWQNPNIVDQSKRDEVLARDKAYCKKKVSRVVPIGARTDGEPPEPTTYEAKFSEDYASAVTFEQCMKNRGWVKK